MRDFVSILEMRKEEILELLELARALKEEREPKLLEDAIVATVFFENSTRTRLSFTTAAYRLGAKVLNLSSKEGSSLMKGESLEDTLRVISSYADLLVLRHPEAGAAKRAVEELEIPVINAGDGKNEHPSQTLLDLYSIEEVFGSLEGRSIAFVGDLKYGRTVHSLTRALAKFGATFHYVAPESLQIPREYLKELEALGLEYELHEDLEEVLDKVEIVYMTRIQRERLEEGEDYEALKGLYQLRAEDVKERDFIVLHPLPRLEEIHPSVDACPQAYYFQQAANGVFVREAMLALALGKK